MTGRQEWRGGKPQPAPVRTPGYRPADVDQAEAVLEELPGERVRPARGGAGGTGGSGGGRLPIGATGILAGVVIAVLLAAGFGVLGDKPKPSPTATTAARTSPPTVVEPLVTPSSACGPERSDVPAVLLEVNGRPTPGRVELVTPSGETIPVATLEPAQPIDIEVDKHTEIWIDGAACALEWAVQLNDGDLERVVNPDRNPGYAAQNRFALQLAPYRAGLGRPAHIDELRASLYFSDVSVVATWPVNILRFDWPAALLTTEGSEGGVATALAQGCDVNLILGNGWTEGADICSDDVSDAPSGAMEIEVGSALRFQFEGWTAFTNVVSCGTLDYLTFVEVPDPDCPYSPDGDPGNIIAPRPGEWTLAINGCASQDVSGAANAICGTWYGNLSVRSPS